jgi:23S rRNA pseudouridine1911/1915/1917 synthase
MSDADKSADRFRIVYDEGRVVVVDKQSGVAVEDVARDCGRRLVHRIDAVTSGLVVLGDDARTVQRMQRSLREGRLKRRYLFVAHGIVSAGVIASQLVRDRGDGLRGSGTGGKRAVTVVEPLLIADDERATLGIETLETGRTHQIRIHLAERGAPICGERVYVRDYVSNGGRLLPSPRLLLHAWELRFVHPTTRQVVDVIAHPPSDFRSAAVQLGVAGHAALT